jgi:predicted nucleic acid-binding protein
MKLFIDTNILLSFYHLTSEDIEELKKLVALVQEGEIDLLVPDQVKDEFYRNRESKISDALKKLRDAKLRLVFPAFCKDYDEYRELKKTIRAADEQHATLVARVVSDATEGELAADAIVASLFEKAKRIQVTKDILDRADRRVRLGNPPGKGDSLGDAINWECLLEAVPRREDVYFVSGDNDHVSALSDEKLSEYLVREWSDDKKSELHFYRQISTFFKENFPNIRLASEVKKDLLIQKLAQSRSFATTHELVGKLSNDSEFTLPQIEQLVSIAETNSQVGWIVSDDDVAAFYSNLLQNYALDLDKKVRERLEALLPDDEDDEDIPF